jgi:hypothetical protein
VIDSGTKNAAVYYSDNYARNIGNSMMNMLLSAIADNPAYRINDPVEQELIDGIAVYRVIDTVFAPGDTLIMIEVKIEYFDFKKTVTSFTKGSEPEGWVPPVIRGAWTANGDLNNTISDMFIDGRNYDLNLNIIPNSGTYGISTSVEFENTQNAAIGGTYDSADYAMAYPEEDDIIEDNYDWGGNFPETPDEILGYPDGTLKSIAQSGVGGSQYIKNPGKIKEELTYPVKGVTYIELTDGVERKLHLIGSGNSGILVVHGPGASSKIKNIILKDIKLGKGKVMICHKPGEPAENTLEIAEEAFQAHIDHGDFEGPCSSDLWFEGLIITDYSFHHHLDILGAIIQLSPELETEKDCNGNKDHWAKFSREAIKNATKIAAKESGLIGNSGYIPYNITGFGTGRQKALHWFE